MAAQQEPACRIRVQVDVAAADAVDRPGVEQVLDGGLHQAQVDQHAQQRRGEQEERLAEVGDLAGKADATAALETVARYSTERALLSATVAARAVRRVKCSVSASSSCCWRSGSGRAARGWGMAPVAGCEHLAGREPTVAVMGSSFERGRWAVVVTVTPRTKRARAPTAPAGPGP
jgi:hypothetical protein